jgi:UDP-N-acetylglucosamine 2-epimerase (non-hydrolysing)
VSETAQPGAPVVAPPFRVALVFGTRPEGVKLLELARLLRADARFAAQVVVTGQHQHMVDEILRPFGAEPDLDLGIMTARQTLNGIIERLLPRLDELYAQERYHLVVVQGDTTSAFAAALAAFHRGIAVAHVEAGLRSFDRFHPYPEEANRRMLSCVTDVHFAPTAYAAENLMREGVPREEIYVTGNSVVDSLMLALQKGGDEAAAGTGRPMVLLTLHRREGWDPVGGGHAPIESLFENVAEAARRHPDIDFVYPVHHNPRVREPAQRLLGSLPNVRLLDPLPYIPFVRLMSQASAILTDSGGIQEEAPTLGVPVLVLRRTTERPEGLTHSRRLLGASADNVLAGLDKLLAEPPARAGEPPFINPFGDGQASARIRDGILHFMGAAERPEEFAEPRPLQSRRGPGPR